MKHYIALVNMQVARSLCGTEDVRIGSEATYNIDEITCPDCKTRLDEIVKKYRENSGR